MRRAQALSRILAATLWTFNVSAAPAVAASEGWTVYTSPASLYSVEYPSDWHVTREENIVNISPPDESGAVTISAYVGLPADPKLVKKLLTSQFAKCEARSQITKEARNDWEGYTQEFVCPNQDGRREWVSTVAQKGGTSVFITAHAESRRMSESRSTYLHILQSLRILEPVSTGDDR